MDAPQSAVEGCDAVVLVYDPGVDDFHFAHVGVCVPGRVGPPAVEEFSDGGLGVDVLHIDVHAIVGIGIDDVIVGAGVEGTFEGVEVFSPLEDVLGGEDPGRLGRVPFFLLGDAFVEQRGHVHQVFVVDLGLDVTPDDTDAVDGFVEDLSTFVDRGLGRDAGVCHAAPGERDGAGAEVAEELDGDGVHLLGGGDGGCGGGLGYGFGAVGGDDGAGVW